MTKQQILILGAGHYAEEVSDLAGQIPGWQVIGFVEGLDRLRCNRLLDGLPVYWIDEIGSLAGTVKALCAVGSPRRENFIQQALDQGIQFTQLFHPMAAISPSAVIGIGTIVFPGAVIGAHVLIGKYVIIGRGALLGHHLQVGDFATINPGANLASSSTIGGRSTIGMGAIVVEGLNIGQKSFVSAGSLVLKDVPDGVQVIGSPAQILRRL
jgi:sugar O-acyltransferase (sialic acid O-acetyltransferase NeuD family)